MATPLLKFGTYQLPLGFYCTSRPRDSTVSLSKLPGRAGSAQQQGTPTKAKITIVGEVFRPIGTTGDTRDAEDALVAALEQGPAPLQLWSDRYYRNAQKTSAAIDSDHMFGRWFKASINFEAGDPYQYELVTQTDTQSGAGTSFAWSLTPGGKAPAAPSFALTVGTTGNLSATLSNTTTGEVCTLIGYVNAGDVIVVDSLNLEVRLNGNTVTGMAMILGVWPTLPQGANALTLTWLATGAHLSQVVTTWQNRYL